MATRPYGLLAYGYGLYSAARDVVLPAAWVIGDSAMTVRFRLFWEPLPPSLCGDWVTLPPPAFDCTSAPGVTRHG